MVFISISTEVFIKGVLQFQIILIRTFFIFGCRQLVVLQKYIYLMIIIITGNTIVALIVVVIINIDINCRTILNKFQLSGLLIRWTLIQ